MTGLFRRTSSTVKSAPEVAIDHEGVRAKRLVQFTEEHEAGWFWETDSQGRITYLSEKVARSLEMFGVSTMGARLSEIFKLDGDDFERARTLSFHLAARTAFNRYSVRGVKGLSDTWWSISGRPWTDEEGNFQGFVGFGSDLTQIRQQETEIKRLALFDGLTGLANRQRMLATLDAMLATRNSDGRQIALMLLDLDGFKIINDTLGHQIGDELLKQVAGRLVRAVGEAGLVGRLGGDEFEVLLPDQKNREQLNAVAFAVIAAVSQPYSLDDQPVTVSCSIGLAIAPDDGEEAGPLRRNADLALYVAKAEGRGVHRFFKKEMLTNFQKRRQLEDDLRIALSGDQLEIFYQPIVSAETEKIVGFEALLRWNHPTLGMVSPAEFIPVAEESGLIHQIGEWVLRTAAQAAAQWPESIRVSINVSPIQFANPSLPALVISAIADAQISPDRLELEITESVFLGDETASEKMFSSLKSIGVRLALDDFGTGYSSLGYLKRAPFDKIKIDQSFVRGAIMSGNRNAAIIRAIVTLAQALGMETTAEGLEHQDEISFIRDLGCSHIQGFVYGKPMNLNDALARIAEASGKAMPIGHRVSRALRTKVLRSARLLFQGHDSEVKIRDISKTGAMIDTFNLPDDELGSDVLIELLENELLPAKIRWIDQGRAGIQFDEPWDSVDKLTRSV